MNVGGHFEGFSKGVKEIYTINKIFEVIPTTMQHCWDTGQKHFFSCSNRYCLAFAEGGPRLQYRRFFENRDGD